MDLRRVYWIFSCQWSFLALWCGVVWRHLSGRAERAQRSGALQLSGRSAWRRGGFPHRATGSPRQDQEQKGTPRFTALALSHPSTVSLFQCLFFFYLSSFLCAWFFSSSPSVFRVVWRLLIRFVLFHLFIYLFTVFVGTLKKWTKSIRGYGDVYIFCAKICTKDSRGGECVFVIKDSIVFIKHYVRKREERCHAVRGYYFVINEVGMGWGGEEPQTTNPSWYLFRIVPDALWIWVCLIWK